jgi:hypothetical protein
LPDPGEPIFSRQEQAVVYLFSRYWDRIDTFKGKRICDIHTHFPDFSLEDKATGDSEAVEFEYALSGFYAHVPEDVAGLKEDGYRVLYVVYWDQDADENCLRSSIREHYKGRLVFVCLNQFFSPCVERGEDSLRASWTFSQTKRFPETYSFPSIQQQTGDLIAEGAFCATPPCAQLYRTIGFNKSTSDSVECDHWKTIHFFTTTRFQSDRIPSRLFVRANRCEYFAGYFDVKQAFQIKRGGTRVKEYFRDFYFYPYDNCYKSSSCLVYSCFRELAYEEGSRLYKYLKEAGYALRQASETVEGSEETQEVNRIIGE